jgi:mono/diheme cytochrome c family protein
MKKGSVVFVFMLSTVYLLGQAKATTQKNNTKSKASSTATATSNLKASIERGKIVYVATCQTCHQVDGGGVPRMNPPLIKTKYVLGDKKHLISILLKGLNDPIEIDDDEFHNPMPPQPQLTDQQIADVITFVRNNFGNKASAVTPTEVKNVRAKLK